MRVVVDASVLLSVYLNETTSLAGRAALATNRLIAPELILVEVANGAWRGLRANRITRADADGVMQQTLTYFDVIVPLMDLIPAALDMAIRAGHPVYDCVYAALAAREGIPLITADRRLADRLALHATIQLLAA